MEMGLHKTRGNQMPDGKINWEMFRGEGLKVLLHIEGIAKSLPLCLFSAV